VKQTQKQVGSSKIYKTPKTECLLILSIPLPSIAGITAEIQAQYLHNKTQGP